MQSEHAIFLLKNPSSVPQDCKDEQKVLKMLHAAHAKVTSQINAPATAIQLCLQARNRSIQWLWKGPLLLASVPFRSSSA